MPSRRAVWWLTIWVWSRAGMVLAGVPLVRPVVTPGHIQEASAFLTDFDSWYGGFAKRAKEQGTAIFQVRFRSIVAPVMNGMAMVLPDDDKSRCEALLRRADGSEGFRRLFRAAANVGSEGTPSGPGDRFLAALGELADFHHFIWFNEAPAREKAADALAQLLARIEAARKELEEALRRAAAPYGGQGSAAGAAAGKPSSSSSGNAADTLLGKRFDPAAEPAPASAPGAGPRAAPAAEIAPATGPSAASAAESGPASPVRSGTPPRGEASAKTAQAAGVAAHRIVSGDTLGQVVLDLLRGAGISATAVGLSLYGSNSLVSRFAAYNGISNPNLIHPGAEIRIPPELLE